MRVRRKPNPLGRDTKPRTPPQPKAPPLNPLHFIMAPAGLNPHRGPTKEGITWQRMT